MSQKIKDYDNTTVGRYIRAIENPDSVGFDRERRVWYNPRLDPRGGKTFDANNRGMGVDVIYNKAATEYTNGDSKRELTEEEERYFRNKHIQESLDALHRQTKKKGIPYPTNSFIEAMAVGAIYRGDAGQLWDASTPVGKAIRETGDGAEWNFRQALNYYNMSKNLPQRVQNSEKFLDNGTMQTQVVPEHIIIEPTKKMTEGGFLNKPKTWDDLSMAEKSDMMKVAVRNGITDLPTIRAKYNEFASGGNLFYDRGNTVGEIVDALYKNNPREEYLGEPEHHYDFTQSDEWADAHGYYPDERGHRDDRVKKPAHPSHPSRGTWYGDRFELSDLGMENPNYTLFGLYDGGQDSQAILTYKGSNVLPELTVTPNGNYIENPYDNIRLHYKALGGNIYDGTTENSQQMETYEAPWVTEAKEREIIRRDWLEEQAEKYAQAVEDAKHPTGHYMNELIVTPNGTSLGSVSSEAMLDNLLSSTRERQAKDRRDASNIVKHIHEGTDTAAKALYPLVAAPAAPYLYSGITGLMANPYVDAALTADGVINAPSKIKEGIEDVRDGNYGSAAWNLGTTALDILGGANLARKATSLVKGRRVPKITSDNVASITPEQWTPEQWTAAQDAAIARGDITEAQRLRDLHFKVSAPNTKIVDAEGNPLHTYHGGAKGITQFLNPNEFDSSIKLNNYYKNGRNRVGIYTSDWKSYAKQYARGYKKKDRDIYDLYVNMENPRYVGYLETKLNQLRNLNPFKERNYLNPSIIRPDHKEQLLKGYDGVKWDIENAVFDGKQLKSADAVTYDNDGVRIPLGERDNFNINDIRYGLLPFILGGSAAANVGKYIYDDNTENSSIYASGGKIHIKPENRGKFTALKKRTGHSASWFKAHGTPAQKKMAVFELNARKWKH